MKKEGGKRFGGKSNECDKLMEITWCKIQINARQEFSVQSVPNTDGDSDLQNKTAYRLA